MQGVVEYCFSGMRFKVRLDQEGIQIAINLLGVKTMQNDKNQPIHLEYAKDAQLFAKETLFQKDVIVEIDFADKRGTFFGSVSLSGNKQDFSEKLLGEGLAHINIVGYKSPKNLAAMEQAEKQAK